MNDNTDKEPTFDVSQIRRARSDKPLTFEPIIPLARNRRLRVTVEVDVLASATLEHAARTLAQPAVAALSELDPRSYKVYSVAVSNVSDGSFIAGWEGTHPHRRTICGECGNELEPTSGGA